MRYFGRISPTVSPGRGARYGFALCSAIAAASVTSFVPQLSGIPFALNFVAIAATAWFGGFSAGLVCTIASAILVNVLVFTPRFTFSASPTALFQTAVLSAVAVFICAIARQREQKEQRLHHVENMFEITLRSIGDAVIATDADGCITFVNGPAEQLTGWSQEQAKGENLNYVLKLENQLTGESVENPVEKVLKTGAVVDLANHTCLISRSGQRIPVEDSAAPIRDEEGGLRGVVFVLRDVSAQYEVEQERRESERLMRELVESISEGFQALDGDWNFRYVNQHGAAISGHTPEELIGKNLWELFPEAIGTKFEAALREAASERRVTRVTDYYAPLGKWIEATAHPTVNGISILFQDVTEGVESEERMRVADRLATAGRFAAAISHEINNPLEAVGNLLYLAKAQSTEDPVRKSLEHAEQQLFRAAHIAKQTLTFYRQTGEATEVSLISTLSDAVSAMRGRFEAHGVSLIVEAQQDATLLISPGEIQQVVTNLLANALDATPRGSQVRVSTSVTAGMAVVEVADSGSGISPAAEARMFDPFFTTKKHLGTGLGLWVSKNIVEKHHGTIEGHNADSSNGAVFRVTLPIVAAGAAGTSP